MTVRSPEIASPVTWSVLERSSNLAATDLLVCGLANSEPAVRLRCLRSLIARRDQVGFQQILLNWQYYELPELTLLRSHAASFVTAARSLLASESTRDKKFALAAITELDITDSVDILLEFVFNSKHPLHEPATFCLLSMSKRLGRLSRSAGKLDCPVRSTLVKKLHGELLRSCDSPVLMEAWLSVVHWDDGPQRGLLLNPSQRVYLRMLSILATTSDPAALQLLAGYFWRNTTPPSIQSLIAEQTHPLLFVEMARLVSDEVLEGLLQKLQSLPPLACLKQFDLASVHVDQSVQRRLLLMLAASSHDFSWTISESVRAAKGGTLDSRRLAADLLLWSEQPSLDQLIRLLQADSLLPNEQQLLTTNLKQVVSWLRGPSTVLRQAAEHIMGEFTLDNLFNQIGHWPAQLCRILAQWVGLVQRDPSITLRDHLDNPAPKRRLAALQVIEWMNCMDSVKDVVLSLLHDPRLEVRVQVIDTLSSLNDAVLEELLPQLRSDANTDIVDAVNRAQRRLDRRKPVISPS